MFPALIASLLPVGAPSFNNSTSTSLTGTVLPFNNSQFFVTLISVVGISNGVQAEDQTAYSSISLSIDPVWKTLPAVYNVPVPSAFVFQPLKKNPDLLIVPAPKTVTSSVLASLPSNLTDG